MEEFLSYSPEDVIAANLAENSDRMDMVCEQEAAHLRELAAQIVSDGMHTSDFIVSLHEHRPPLDRVSPLHLPQNQPLLREHHAMHAVWKSVLLSRELRRLIGEQRELRIEDFFSEIEELPDGATGRVVYQRNSYADSAYLRFAPLIQSPRALYSHSFQTVCEEVYNGNCEYCILPVENSAEGPLNSFSRLIDRFELKISATCDVPTNDGSRTTRFALLRRDLLPLSRSREQVLLFEFSVPLSEHPLTADLLNAASCCGLQLCRLDSRPYPGVDRSSLSTHFLFRVENGDLYSYLLYLFMEAPQFSPIGIYLHLDDEKKNTQTI